MLFLKSWQFGKEGTVEESTACSIVEIGQQKIIPIVQLQKLFCTSVKRQVEE